MDQESNIESHEGPSIRINLNPEASFDNLEFKPINEGLGFHQHKKRLFQNSVPSVKSTKFKSGNITQRIKKPVVTHTANIVQEFRIDKPIVKRKLYKEKKALNTNRITASNDVRLLAWIVDIFFIGALESMTILGLMYFSYIPLKVIVSLISISEFVMFSGIIFSLYYLIYFTILDLVSSPGKILLGIELEKVDKSKLSGSDTFRRSLGSLISFVMLGIPLLIDLQGRLSKSRIVK